MIGEPCWVIFVLMRFLQTSVDAATTLRLSCTNQIFLGGLQTELAFSQLSFTAFDGDICGVEKSYLFDGTRRFYFCTDCLVKCAQRVEEAPSELLIVSDLRPPNTKVSWFQLISSSLVNDGNRQCNVTSDYQQSPATSMEETSTDALRSFSKTSVLFVSISFIILMVISLAWLVFYYIQRFRYAHAKDRLQRRLFNAARKALARIPTRSVRSGDEELQTDCAVCLDPYQLHDIVRILPCKHAYHKSCIDPWLLEHRTCPMCKADILKYFGYHYCEVVESSRNGDEVGRVEIGDNDRDRSPNEILSPEGTSDSSDSHGFSFDHHSSENHETFTITPTVAPQLVLNATNAKTFARATTAPSQSPTQRAQCFSARSLREDRGGSSAEGGGAVSFPSAPSHQRVIRPSASGSTSSCSASSQGQIVNLVQVKSRATSVTRAATIRKESLPTPVDVLSTERPTTSSNTQVV